jgi:hypothetical protein
MQPIHYRLSFAAIGLLLLLAIANLDFFFYNFLRAIVSIGGGLLIFRALRTKQFAWCGAGVPSIVLFNHWFGFEFPKATWIPIDFVFGILFLGAAIYLGKPFKLRLVEPEEIDDDTWMDAYDKGIILTPQSTLEDEINDFEVWKAIAIVAGVLLFCFGMWGIAPSPGSCPNYVQDSRGGYCEG